VLGVRSGDLYQRLRLQGSTRLISPAIGCYVLFISVHLLFVIYVVLRTRFFYAIPMYELL
jgi:hypothetical protein